MVQTMGSLEKENKACREANSPQHVNLGLAEMGCSKSAFLSHQWILDYFCKMLS